VHIPHYALTYETDLRNVAQYQDAMYKLIAFLGLESIVVGTSAQRMGSDYLADYVVNFDGINQNLLAKHPFWGLLSTMLKRLKRDFYRQLRPKFEPHQKPVTVFDGELLRGKQVLVTGAGGNLGRAMIKAIQKQQGQALFTELSEELVASVEQDCPGAQGIIVKKQSTEEILAFLDERAIVPHILVNNVGVSAEKSFWEETQADWEYVFHANVITPVSLTKAIATRMVANQIAGSILFISSTHQTTPSRWPSYSASKAALNMVIKELAIDLAGNGIRVNGVAPGWSQPETRFFKMALLEKRTIAPEYIAHAVIFLSSYELSRFTTGIVLTVDAGVSLYSGRTVIQPPPWEMP